MTEPRVDVLRKKIKARVEWAVIEPIFRGTNIVKGGLGSKEEAEAWMVALEITRSRSDHEHFMATDGIVMRGEMSVAWRFIDYWHSDEEPDTEWEIEP